MRNWGQFIIIQAGFGVFTHSGPMAAFCEEQLLAKVFKNVFDPDRWLDLPQKLRSYAHFKSVELPSASHPRAPLCRSRTGSKSR